MLKGQFGGGLHGVYGRLRRQHITRPLAGGVPGSGEHRSIGFRGAQFIGEIARAARLLPNFRFGERDGAGQQIAVNDLIEDAGFQSVRCLDRIAARAHLDRLLDARQARQALRSRRAGDDAEFHFRLPDLRIRYRYAIVAGHGCFQAAAERRAVNRRHNGLARFFHRIQNLIEAWPAACLARSHFAELFDVRAGDKRSPAADQDDRFHAVVFAECFHAGQDPFRHSRAQRVDWRIVHCENSNLTRFTGLYKVAHGH